MKNNFYKNLKYLREFDNLSQEELSKKTNISQSSIARWELNKTQPRIDEIIILADYFNLSIEQLIFGIYEDSNFEILNNKNYYEEETKICAEKLHYNKTIRKGK